MAGTTVAELRSQLRAKGATDAVLDDLEGKGPGKKALDPAKLLALLEFLVKWAPSGAAIIQYVTELIALLHPPAPTPTP